MGEPVLDRVFRILQAFGPSDRSLTLTSLSVRADLPKSSALRIVRKLVQWGALERTARGEFVIGLRLLEIASLAPRGHGLRATALPYMEDLHHASGQHVLLAVRDELEAVLVERLSARQAGNVLYRVGGRLPLHATGVGLVLLANASADLQEQVLEGDLTLTPEGERISSLELRAPLAEVRHSGSAVVSRQYPEPMTSVAAPVFAPDGAVIAALSVVAPLGFDATAAKVGVIAVARAVSRAITQSTTVEPHDGVGQQHH
ncbi:IclR family transcriptional regulator [Amycolatopsis sp. H20-H5]|uniref:IclR family transcriptional regulator n=1 Tax=Amycolatopsis sp. H20-H5 TaxID=3046309 RepID=UPI002DC05A88|nr:IclR family transcriptional regulator [Amycolatopsis sp. H20-H5]MEC3974450.1 IclR family transcriptional regulator [Amycolatopsis sp. H20-H5]